MLGYAILMFLVAAAFAYVAVAIYKGKTSLIHDYHQANVTDRVAYGKAFGKALSVFAIAPLLSGTVGLLGKSEGMVYAAVAVLIIGIAIGIACLVSVQKKYNGGLF